ncbi:MAG: ABC transporter substrate-binding protein [Alphaproteobacteria bacterium]|nr:ABC transporter substrate-binding protein [Alphaproteobacteria bacterium]
MSRLSRRLVLASGVAALGAPAIVGAQARRQLKISVGRQPWAAGNSPVTQHMMAAKSLEQTAQSLGYDLTVDYREYPSALPMVEALLSGNLDFGMWGNTPIVRLIAQSQPLAVLSVGEGHLRFVIAVRKGSPIRTVADLKGKTVGALLGGDPYNALSQILKFELGNGDPKAHGITVVNTPTQAQAAALPAGMDAAVVIHPAYLKANAEIGTTAIVNSFGYTEANYKGPAGEGAGKLLESAKASPFFPDGYYLHRSFWIASPKTIRDNPPVTVAFLMAQQDAVAKLAAMAPGDVSELVSKYWGLPKDQGAEVVKDEVLFKRGWCWPTEGDAAAILEVSKFMVEGRLIEKPLAWSQVKESFRLGAALHQEAYEKSGRKPEAAAFAAKDVQDLRGLPVWDLDKWKDRT